VSEPRRVPERLYAGYVFDLDGAIYLGSERLPGAARVLRALRELRRKVVFVSNNPTRDPEEYAVKLSDLGVPAPASQVINTVVTTTDWLAVNAPEATVFPVSEEPLKRALRRRGIRLSEDPAEIDIVIASYDRHFDYRKLQIAFDAIRAGARLMATNPDRFCPFPGGRGEPDAAAITAAIEACTGASCELHFGKPGPVMLQAVAAALELAPADCLLTGDRLTTDIQAAREASMASALVLTGETAPPALAEIAAEDRPDYVLDRIDRLVPVEQWEELGW
jgi:HAD superfamily hydrolase (TIGR01450 family)